LLALIVETGRQTRIANPARQTEKNTAQKLSENFKSNPTALAFHEHQPGWLE